jgi:Asp-tRNA(Asn)/Glu-tRNA(Gln) amidotransferase A subunit family amidase
MHALTAVERAMETVRNREPTVRAWAFLDPDRARAEARALDARPGDPGPLDGLVLGVKDMFDTADQPTEYGSPIFAGHRPIADAGAVWLLRAAGAVCLGKTVTAELAGFHPGPTTNPHRPSHTPGGSSMGSAAAVATGMADVALGTQTAGSIVRPASYCGLFGFKPTFGSVTTSGLKLVAPSLDTVGWFARSTPQLDAIRVVLTGRSPAVALGRPPRLGLLAADAAVTEAARRAHAAQAGVGKRASPDWLGPLSEAHQVVHQYEAARALAWEHCVRRSQLSPNLAEFLDRGAAIDAAAYDAALESAAEARRDLSALFEESDVLLTPAAPGEAPEGLETTGDPHFSRPWTLLGLPCLSVPGLVGATGLPLGVQLVGRPGDDALVLAVGAWLGRVIGNP